MGGPRHGPPKPPPRRSARPGEAGVSLYNREEYMSRHDALRTILPVAGWSDDRAGAVEITGAGDPILPTPFRIGETTPAALAAAGPAVPALQALRCRRGHAIAVDTRQATA